MSITSPATNASPATSTASPTRPSRLRGLSYLRNYTHTHFQHSRDSSTSSTTSSRPFGLIRATSYPAPSTTQTQATASNTTSSRRPVSPIQQSSELQQETNGLSRIATAPLDNVVPVSEDASEETEDMGRLRTRSSNRLASAAVDPEVASTNRAADVISDNTVNTSEVTQQSASVPASANLPSIRLSQHQDPRANRPSLAFTAMQRTLPTGKEVLKVGRYSEREQVPTQAFNVASAAPIGFKSKVVSRRHCELWTENGSWFIKDVKSSSGTFLNHVRLSSPGQESKPFPVKDGDIIQLGIDFKGGEEMIFRCVKIRVELNRNWQAGLNTFNKAAHKKLRNMAQDNSSPSSAASSQDCSICLGRVAPCQALFVAPCSHTWHYKCIRRILNGPTWPQFVCPNCRAVADLEAEVDEPIDEEEWEEVEDPAEAAVATDDITTQHATVSNDDDILEVENAHLNSEPIDEEGQINPPESTNIEHRYSNGMNQRMHVPALNNNLRRSSTYVDGAAAEPVNEQLVNEESNATSAPINIRGSISRSVRDAPEEQSSSDGIASIQRTPIDLPHHLLTLIDGPMTPRNDVGPFVFDGSAGRVDDTKTSIKKQPELEPTT